MHNWLWNSAELKSPWKANGVVLLLGCFTDSGRVATHTGAGEQIFFSQEYRRHLLTRKQLWRTKFLHKNQGSPNCSSWKSQLKAPHDQSYCHWIWGKRQNFVTKVSFFLPLVPIRGESKQYHRQFEGTKRVSRPVSLSQHDSPCWPWLCELLLST